PAACSLKPWPEISMDIERYDPWEEFDRLQEQINRLFDDFFGRLHAVHHVSFAPAVDVYESDGHLVIRVDLPGIVEDDVDIMVDERTVVIRGERDHPADAVPGRYHRREWPYGLFERRIDLPAPVLPEMVSASYADGVFQIRLPIAGRDDDGG
ncbi:MAG TPA: Hsp20/alpha crystallin family protein, partial [Thermoguttaceae bacterium]|nr:Hsp20/alpha crystallin family protein [Thermoguttaceae bacterium]